MKSLVFSLVIASFLFSSCTLPGAPQSRINPSTEEVIVPANTLLESTGASTPEATVTSTPATPADVEPTVPDSDLPLSPASDVVIPIGSESNTSNSIPQSE